MSRDRNNLKAGLFVVLGMALLLVVIFTLADFSRYFIQLQTAETQFSIADGLNGLKVGAEVTIADVTAGAVTAIDDILEGGVIVGKKVAFTIPARYKLHENARIELNTPPLGSGTKLNIASFGFDTGQPGFKGAGWHYEPGDPPIPGGIAPSQLADDFVKKLGIEDQQRRQIQNIIANVEKLSAALAADVPALTESLRKQTPDILAKVNDIVSQVHTHSPAWWKNVDGLLAGGDKAVASLNAILEENRPVLASALKHADVTLANAEEISSNVRQQTLAKINTALDTANKAVEDVYDMTGNLKSLVAAQRPVLERAIANARLVSDQLKLAAIEIRRSPWRLMYSPTNQELESDNIYDAARSFATAADALNSTADSLQAVLDRYGSRVQADDPNFKLMLDALRQTFEKFAQAEKQFFNALGHHGSGK
jgi:ABC-type transporter Mla subunit MlaD